MGKLSSLIGSIKEKANQTLVKIFKSKKDEHISETSKEYDTWVDKIIVTDYAAAQGAKHYGKTGNEVLDRYNWIACETVAPKYKEKATNLELDGEVVEEPIFYKEVVGIAPVINPAYNYGFKVRGGLMMYNGEYVKYPQRRVDQTLNMRLTSLLMNKNPEAADTGFKRINYKVKTYGDDIKNGVYSSVYFYDNNVYYLRIDADNKNDKYQWYGLSTVAAKYENDRIQCEDILIADHIYNEKKFVEDLIGNVELIKSLSYKLTIGPKLEN